MLKVKPERNHFSRVLCVFIVNHAIPENFRQPVTNRQECYKCHKTVTWKKEETRLSKCSSCHANIKYYYASKSI